MVRKNMALDTLNPRQVLVQINGKQWTCSVANTYIELVTGLSGMPSIPSGTGMLFDLGYDYKTIQIDMTGMLFPLDIIFINSTQGVVGVMQNVEPGETDVRLENEQLPGARCFLEVNAGEAEGIEDGDNVAIQGYAQPTQLDVSNLMNYMVIMVFVVMMFRMVDKALELPEERTKLPPVKPPPGYVPVGAAKKAPARATEEEELRERKLALESKGREIAKEADVEFVRLDEGWQSKYATLKYWFRDPKGNEIIARDLEELKWKLGRDLTKT